MKTILFLLNIFLVSSIVSMSREDDHKLKYPVMYYAHQRDPQVLFKAREGDGIVLAPGDADNEVLVININTETLCFCYVFPGRVMTYLLCGEKRTFSVVYWVGPYLKMVDVPLDKL